MSILQAFITVIYPSWKRDESMRSSMCCLAFKPTTVVPGGFSKRVSLHVRLRGTSRLPVSAQFSCHSSPNNVRNKTSDIIFNGKLTFIGFLGLKTKAHQYCESFVLKREKLCPTKINAWVRFLESLHYTVLFVVFQSFLNYLCKISVL